MNGHPVRAAVDLVDAEPSTEFLSALRAQLLAEGTAPASITPRPRSSASETVEDYVMVAPSITPKRSNRRLRLVLLGAASCAAALATIFVINRPTNDSQGGDGLRDVDPEEAFPLGQAAMFSADLLAPPESSVKWQQVDDFSVSDYATQTAAINAATPACAQLAAAGLAQPTEKSVIVHQDFANGPVPMLHDVWVFATPEDASQAMDVIDGDVYPACLFQLFDRLTALNRNITALSTSTSWLAPQIPPHGDRQITIGQQIDYTIDGGGAASVQAINVYVQVGRAIAFIDPQYLSDVSATSNVEQAITASTNALKKVFGP